MNEFLNSIWRELIDLTILRRRVVKENDLVGRLFASYRQDETSAPTWEQLEQARAALEKKVPGWYVWYLKEENAYCLLPDTSQEPGRQEQQSEDSTEYLQDLNGHNQEILWERAQDASQASDAQIEYEAEVHEFNTRGPDRWDNLIRPTTYEREGF